MTRTERTYYLVYGLYNVAWSFLGPVYALFLLSRGLDLFQINLVLATFLLTSFLFEVPTGAVADVFGRKVSVLASCAVRAVAFALYAISDSFAEFLFAEFVDAVGMTLATGALDAWAVDGMRAEGDHRSTDRFFAKAQILARTLMILSGLVGGYVAAYDLRLPWVVGAVGFAATGVIAAVLMSETVHPVPAARPRPTLRRSLSVGIATVRDQPVARLLCLLTLATGFAMMPVYQLWQPRMEDLAGGVWVMGWIWAFLNVSTIIGSAIIPRLLGRFSRPHLLAVAAIWRAASVVVAALAFGLFPAVIGLCLQEMAFGFSEPLLQAWMNEQVEDEQRATVLSVRSMAFTFGGSAGLVVLGLVARGYGIPTAWVCSAAIIGLTPPGYLLLGRIAQRLRSQGASPGIAPAAVTGGG
jgi:MFS family permease